MKKLILIMMMGSLFANDTHSSGVYFVKMVAGSYVNTQKLMLVK